MIPKPPLAVTVKSILLFIVICAVIAAQVFAQVKDEIPTNAGSSISPIQGTCWALLVGIGDYPPSEAAEIQKLKAPVKDVNALAELLKDPKKGRFDPNHVFVLTNEDAEKEEILKKLEEISKLAASEDMVIFYFSGHGYFNSNNGRSYLIPYDYDLNYVRTKCIDFGDLEEMVHDMKANKVVVILDACYSGGVRPKDPGGARPRDAASAYLVRSYLEAFRASEGRALLLSSDETEVSWETDQYGIFTHFLLEALDGEADEDKDGIVTFTEVFRYVEGAVQEHTRENFGRVQRPSCIVPSVYRGDIPMSIDWETLHKNLQLERNEAIYRVGLDDTLREFSLQVTRSAYQKTINDEELQEREISLLREIDLLKDMEISPEDYIDRAQSIYRMGISELRVALASPADGLETRVTVAPADAPGQTIEASSPNTYEVPRGRYIVSVQQPGYKAYSSEVVLGQAREILPVTLERLMGTLKLQVEPDDAIVSITPLSVQAPDNEIMTGKPIPIEPKTERGLPIGEYRVTAEKDGYETGDETFVLAVGDSLPVTLKLSPKPATIVAPDLPTDARVFVNGREVTLPFELPPGTYTVRLERDGFQPFETSGVLKPGDELPLRPTWITIKPPVAHLKVAVSPADSKVTLASADAPDQAVKPSSPNNYQVKPGRYILSVSRSGYEPRSREIALDQEMEKVSLTLERLTGTLKLQLEPDDAEATLTPISIEAPDGEIEEGKSIVIRATDAKELPVGRYRLTIQKDGYKQTTSSFDIEADDTRLLTVALRQVELEPATIMAPDLPDGTRVLIDSKPVELPYKIPPGKHKILVERDGFQPFETSEQLTPAQVLSLKPEWKQIVIGEPIFTEDIRLRTISLGQSLLVPGLGQHLQGRHIRGAVYEVIIAGAGIATLLARSDYQYDRKQYEEKGTEQRYDEAQSSRNQYIAMQVIFFTLWGINAADAGIIKPRQQSDEVAFEARPTLGGLQLLVSARF